MTTIMATLIGLNDETEYNTNDTPFDELPEQSYKVQAVEVDDLNTSGEKFVHLLGLEGETVDYDEVEELCDLLEFASEGLEVDYSLPFDIYEEIAYVENCSGVENLMQLAYDMEYLRREYIGDGSDLDIGLAITQCVDWKLDEIEEKYGTNPTREDLEEIGRTYKKDFNFFNGYMWRRDD